MLRTYNTERQFIITNKVLSIPVSEFAVFSSASDVLLSDFLCNSVILLWYVYKRLSQGSRRRAHYHETTSSTRLLYNIPHFSQTQGLVNYANKIGKWLKKLSFFYHTALNFHSITGFIIDFNIKAKILCYNRVKWKNIPPVYWHGY